MLPDVPMDCSTNASTDVDTPDVVFTGTSCPKDRSKGLRNCHRTAQRIAKAYRLRWYTSITATNPIHHIAEAMCDGLGQGAFLQSQEYHDDDYGSTWRDRVVSQ